jgi:hypothetical protein
METLVTIEDFAAYLKRDLDAFDAYTAQLLLNGACDAVTDYCGWHIAPVLDATVVVDGTGTAIQTLPTMNLLSLTSVSEDGRALDVTGIDWSTNGVMEKRRGGCWTGRRRGVITQMGHGFATTPGWVITLVCAVAGRAIGPALAADARSGPITQETSGGESVTYSAPRTTTLPTAPPGTVTLLTFEKRMLDRIRVPLAA